MSAKVIVALSAQVWTRLLTSRIGARNLASGAAPRGVKPSSRMRAAGNRSRSRARSARTPSAVSSTERPLVLNASNGFAGLIDLNLAASDYIIGLVASDINDPNFSITFNTPVQGAALAAVPEPGTMSLLGGALAGFILIRIR